MKVGCFAIVDPFALLEHQLGRIRDMGFRYADVTDNHRGGLLGREFGFAATVSLDDNPFDIKRLFESYGLTITSFCAHANLLDPSSPARYATNEVMQAVRQAAAMGVKHVITTEGDPKSAWGHKLTHDQRVFITAEKLHEPLRLANDLGVYLLLEPHGMLTDSISGIQDIMEMLGAPENLGVNLDTGNSWLGGADPMEMARVFKDKIMHVHWKDLPADWEAKRGTMYGCGFGPIALGEGVVDIAGVYNTLKDAPHLEYSTLEVGGEDNLKKSYAYLKTLGAE
ncbi:MAG TPA: sugar phosphate isomerase/epimerase [Caldilinea sp.]|mgnify:FL=1|nr:sugar phosphate isomerase/epimerase [Anaerolineales bacterium]HRA65859.1 sugar phosphate isomerase/epimerase [Caldilinea sp.]